MKIRKRKSNKKVGGAAAFVTAIDSPGAVVVPESVQLTPTMAAADFSTIPLIPIDVAEGIGEEERIMAKEAVMQNMGPAGSIVFVVRRPGCVLCREHGQQLLLLSVQDDSPLEGFEIIGVVKEIGVVSSRSSFFSWWVGRYKNNLI